MAPRYSSNEQFTRRAILLGILTLILLVLSIFFGIPFLIRLATFWDQQKQTPPAKEIIAPLPPRFTNSPEATNSATITLDGLADPNSVIALYSGTKLLATTKSDQHGSFCFDHIGLQPGKNSFWAIAERDQQKSNTSGIYTIIFDNQPPQLEIKKPSNATSVSYQETAEIQGKTEPNAKLTINDHLVLVDSEGHFSTKMELASGDNKFIIRAEDNAGNMTEKTIVITYHP